MFATVWLQTNGFEACKSPGTKCHQCVQFEAGLFAVSVSNDNGLQLS